MHRKVTRTALVVMAMAGITLAGVPAQAAQPGPRVPPGYDVVFTWYNNAQHSVIVGQESVGNCPYENWGVQSAYRVTSEYKCPPGPAMAHRAQ